MCAISIDGEVGCSYIWVIPESQVHRIAQTVEVRANLDINDKGEIVGVEVLGWPKEDR